VSERSQGARIGRVADWTPAAVILIAGFAMFAGVSSLILDGQISTTPDVAYSTTLLLLVTCSGLLLSVFDRRAALADMFFWVYFVFFMAWPGWIQAMTTRFPWGLRHGPDSTVKAVSVTIAFLICYATVSKGLRWREATPKKVKAATAKPALVVGFLLGALVVATACAALVGSNLFVSRVEVGKSLSDTSMSYPYFIGKGVALAGLLVSLATVRAGGRRSPVRVALIVGFGLLTALLFNPLGNPRFQTLGVIFCLLAFVLVRPSAIQKAIGATALGASTLGLFAAFKQLGQTGTIDLSSGNFLEAPFSIDFDSLQQMIAAITYVKGFGFSWGQNLLSAIFFFIPRQIWPGKAEPTGIVVATNLNYYYTNLSSPLPAEGYIALSWVGCLALAAFTAWLITRLERGAARTRSGANVDRCLYAVISGYTVILLRGSLGSVLPQFGVVFLTLLLAQWLGVFGRKVGGSNKGPAA
jgi:hypothetical protein